MKILICPDSFKESIDAKGVAEAIAVGIRSVLPEAQTFCMPVADGGEGTLDILTDPLNRHHLTVTGPNGKAVCAEYGYFQNHIAVIEMAQAAGLTLVPKEERNPLKESTFGVGELILDALSHEYREILLTAGGSATNDGGTGAIEALGAKFYDCDGNLLHACGENLEKIETIDSSGIDPRLAQCSLTIATDVKKPLCGESGATLVYGPQKGANVNALQQLERGMRQYAKVLERTVKKEIATIPGCGAAGGLPAPFLAFSNAKICSGIQYVLDAWKFREALVGCDAVITGEGKTDGQSASGKVLDGIANLAKEFGVPVYVLSGCVGEGYEKLLQNGITEIRTIVGSGVDPKESIKNPAPYLTKLAEELAKSSNFQTQQGFMI